MQIQNSLGDFYRKSSFILPRNDFNRAILQIGPKWAFGTVFENDAIVRIDGDSLK